MGETTASGPLDLGGRSFDHYARLVQRFLGVPTALVTLVESDRQVFPGVVGLPEPWQQQRQTPLTHSLCQHVVADGRPLIATDVREDPRLADSLAISELGVVAYAGWPLLDAAGRPVGSLCAIDAEPREWTPADIAGLEDLATACSAEIQHAVAQIEATRGLARSVVDAVDVAMVVIDEHQRVLMANGRAEAVAAAAGFDLDHPPYAGPRVWRADRQEAVPLEDQVVPRAMRGEAVSREIEWYGPPGEQVAVVATTRRLEGPTPDGARTLVVLHDVTELAMSQEIRERVSATVAHELRTPLTAILGYLELLGDDLDVGDPAHAGTVRSLERIRRSADSLVARIGRVHETSDRRRHHGLRASDVTEVVRRALESFGPVAGPGGRVVLRADDQQWANVDDARIEQAVENLVGNALKYSGPDGRVSVWVLERGDDVDIAVADTGVGMTPDEVARVFDPYWRSSAARGSAVGGLGLGLPLVQDIVAEHHGRVDIASLPGEGTTVTLSLPRVPI